MVGAHRVLDDDRRRPRVVRAQAQPLGEAGIGEAPADDLVQALVDELRNRENFLYRNNVLVTRFEEVPDAVRVHGIDTAAGEAVSHVCRRLVLAPGVLGSARIVVRSFDRKPELPILCNPYCYLACIQPALLGAPARGRQVGFSQLSLFHDPTGSNFDVAMASIYSYRSLMLFRIVREAPVALSDAYPIMRYRAT